MSQQIRAEEILQALERYHRDRRRPDLFFREVKTGSSLLPGELRRLDAVALKASWSTPCITLYEVKVSRRDFRRDQKWLRYRDYGHRLVLACPQGMIQPGEIPPEVGLCWYVPESGRLRWRRRPLFRNIPLPTGLLYYLVLWRTGQAYREQSLSQILSRWSLSSDPRVLAQQIEELCLGRPGQ